MVIDQTHKHTWPFVGYPGCSCCESSINSCWIFARFSWSIQILHVCSSFYRSPVFMGQSMLSDNSLWFSDLIGPHVCWKSHNFYSTNFNLPALPKTASCQGHGRGKSHLPWCLSSVAEGTSGVEGWRLGPEKIGWLTTVYFCLFSIYTQLYVYIYILTVYIYIHNKFKLTILDDEL